MQERRISVNNLILLLIVLGFIVLVVQIYMSVKIGRDGAYIEQLKYEQIREIKSRGLMEGSSRDMRAAIEQMKIMNKLLLDAKKEQGTR